MRVNILFAASEAYPFVKTGGLADVAYALPAALTQSGDDARTIIPAYRDVLAGCEDIVELGSMSVQGAATQYPARILQVSRKGVANIVYLVDIPALYDRPGNPYADENGIKWPDHAERYVVFCRAVAQMPDWLAEQDADHRWFVDVVHCNDWQTGLVPALLSELDNPPVSVFTIHNLAYDGNFSHADFVRLDLPEKWWSSDFVEFYGGFSTLKAGMVFADAVTTVSPTYAQEIRTPEFGYRYEGILTSLGDKFSGILNGIDLDIWNPQTDPYIKQHYATGKQLAPGKRANKLDLLARSGLPEDDAPLLGFIGRLVEQKGMDLIIDVLPRLFRNSDARMIILGSGHSHYQAELLDLVAAWPDRLFVFVGFSEAMAHQIEAGCDLFLMPSLFEPCGLNQMYSLRYATLPVVNNTGGLADTVTQVNEQTLAAGTATGFVMQREDADSLYASLMQALQLYSHRSQWDQVRQNAMQQNLGWESSAAAYHQLYTSLIAYE